MAGQRKAIPIRERPSHQVLTYNLPCPPCEPVSGGEACVAVNRRFSVPITRSTDGKLAFAGDGETVEWAVHMRRFDQSALLSSIATTGPVSDDLANGLAGVVYGSHAGAKRN